MVEKIDLLIHNTSQICTVPAINGRAQRGKDLGTLRLIERGAIAIHNGKIVAVDNESAIREKYNPDQEVDAAGNAVIPGLVDPHTHLVWAGERAAEFEMRIGGTTYMEI